MISRLFLPKRSQPFCNSARSFSTQVCEQPWSSASLRALQSCLNGSLRAVRTLARRKARETFGNHVFLLETLPTDFWDGIRALFARAAKWVKHLRREYDRRSQK